MKTALIVDSDLSFGYWLARGLDHAGYQAYPSKSVTEATALISELGIAVDLLILNAMLADQTEWVEGLRRANEHVRVVALIGDQPRLAGIATRVDLCCRKPNRHNDGKLGEWIKHVEELLPVSLFGATFENSLLLRKCAGALVWGATHTRAARPSWKEWEGRTIDGRFKLERCLGGGEESAVFLTNRDGNTAEPAAIRVVLNESVGREILLPRWERAARLSHPGLVRLIHMGNGESGGEALSYLVMEYAEENLADVLKQRPLTTEETRELLEPVLDALSYLHGRGLVHGRVKPSNILAVAEQLKISSDGLRQAGEKGAATRERGVYDAPEATAGFVSPAADVWSLGITLVEALTQRPIASKRPPNKPPSIPVTLPPLFLDLARQCLQPDPQQRETAEHLADRLRQAPTAEPAARSKTMRLRFRNWAYALPAVALGLALSGMLVRPHLKTAAVAPRPPQPVAPAPAPSAMPAAALPSMPAAALPSMPAPAELSAPPSPPAPEASAEPVVRHVSEKILPEVSKTALATVQGTLEVRIQARVDASGTVVDAKLDEPGSSRYFATRSLAAARRWKFDKLPAQSRAASEEWLLRFEYTNKGAEASGEPVTP